MLCLRPAPCPPTEGHIFSQYRRGEFLRLQGDAIQQIVIPHHQAEDALLRQSAAEIGVAKLSALRLQGSRRDSAPGGSGLFSLYLRRLQARSTSLRSGLRCEAGSLPLPERCRPPAPRGILQRGEDLTDLAGIGNAVHRPYQVKFACHLGHAEFNAVCTSGKQMLKGAWDPWNLMKSSASCFNNCPSTRRRGSRSTRTLNS